MMETFANGLIYRLDRNLMNNYLYSIPNSMKQLIKSKMLNKLIYSDDSQHFLRPSVDEGLQMSLPNWSRSFCRVPHFSNCSIEVLALKLNFILKLTVNF